MAFEKWHDTTEKLPGHMHSAQEGQAAVPQADPQMPDRSLPCYGADAGQSTDCRGAERLTLHQEAL